LITLERVTKCFQPGVKAVDDLSLEVAEGETCVLVGPSGCGKTTTMRMINRLIEPTSGEICVGGKNVKEQDVIKLRRSIGYVIQEIGLFPHMTVAENITTVPTLLGWPAEKKRERAEELLELMGLDPTEYASKYPRQLSGGQRQRVGVARALGADPPVLLMDEPFGAIDPITRERLQNEFLRIQKQIKKTIVFVTHDINEAIKMGDRIAIMREGRLVQYATPDVLLSQPADKFVADFVGTDRALKRLNIMRVYEVMERDLPAARVSDTTDQVAAFLDKHDLNWCYVLTEEGRLAGHIFRDDLKEIEGEVGHHVRPSSTTLEATATLADALSEMLTYAVSQICVVDEKGRVQGAITFGHLEKAIQDDPKTQAGGATHGRAGGRGTDGGSARGRGGMSE